MKRFAMLSILAGTIAHAQPAGDEAYRDGKALLAAGNYDGAIAKFEAAYAIRKDLASLFNIAEAYRKKGDCAEAWRRYHVYRQTFPTAPNLAQVTTYIGELEACAKERGAIEPTPPAPPPPEPPPPPTTRVNPLDPHARPIPIAPRAPAGIRPNAPAGGTSKAAPAGGLDGPAAIGGTGLAPRETTGDDDSKPFRMAGLVTMGIGFTGLFVGLMGGLKTGQIERSRDRCIELAEPPFSFGCSAQEIADYDAEGRNWNKVTYLGLGIGGGLMAVGIGLFVYSGIAAPSSKIAIVPSTNGVMVTRGFRF